MMIYQTLPRRKEPLGPLVYVDFQTLAIGQIDETNVTSPTLTELNGATIGADWSFEGAARGEGFIRADADPANDTALEISTTNSGGSVGWMGRLDFNSPVLVSSMGSGYLEINFTTATKRSSGFTRDAFWKINDGTTELFTLTLDDGFIWLDGSSFGEPSGVADNYSVNPWDSTSTTVGKNNVWPVSIKIYGDGSLDVDWDGYTTSKVAGTVSPAASVGRMEVNSNLTGGGNGIYFSIVEVNKIT